MTEKLYEVDSYVQNFTAQVVSCTPVPGGFAVVLDRTAFFPEGGGQPCDTGRLGGARVLAVHTDGETITHTTDAPLTAGETVDGCLDWPARLDAMQQHTGEHILSGALHRLFGAENVGFHIGSPYVRMDTSIPLTQEQLADKTLSNVREVKSRGAKVLIVCPEALRDRAAKDADELWVIPDAASDLLPLLAIIPVQLFAYYMAVSRGCDVDKPRNLAKSVTVE